MKYPFLINKNRNTYFDFCDSVKYRMNKEEKILKFIMNNDRIDVQLSKLEKRQIIRLKNYYNKNYYQLFADHKNAIKMREFLNAFSAEREIKMREMQYHPVLSLGNDNPVFEELYDDNYSESLYHNISDDILRGAVDT